MYSGTGTRYSGTQRVIYSHPSGKNESGHIRPYLHCVQEYKVTPPTIYDRNTKSQHILTELHAVDSEYVCETKKFLRKHCLTVQLLIFKHPWQNISVSNTALLSGRCGWCDRRWTPSTSGFLFHVLSGEKLGKLQADWSLWLNNIICSTWQMFPLVLTVRFYPLPRFCSMVLSVTMFSNNRHCPRLVRKFRNSATNIFVSFLLPQHFN